MRRIRPASLGVASQSLWRIATPLPAALHKSHQNGGRVFLIFVADPTGSPAPSEASVGTTRRVEEGLRGDALEPTLDRTDRYRGSYSQKTTLSPLAQRSSAERQARACPITMLMPVEARRFHQMNQPGRSPCPVSLQLAVFSFELAFNGCLGRCGRRCAGVGRWSGRHRESPPRR